MIHNLDQVMNQIKVFSGPTPSEVEARANEWLRDTGEAEGIRMAHATSTDTVHVSASTGIQRFSICILYQVGNSSDGEGS